jgi:hypothetical protein
MPNTIPSVIDHQTFSLVKEVTACDYVSW